MINPAEFLRSQQMMEADATTERIRQVIAHAVRENGEAVADLMAYLGEASRKDDPLRHLCGLAPASLHFVLGAASVALWDVASKILAEKAKGG